MLIGSNGNPIPTAASFSGTALVVCAGDSITANNFGQISWPGLYKGATGSSLTVINSGVSGYYLSSVVAQESTNIAYIAANPGKTNYVYAVSIGVNNANLGPVYYPTDWAGFATDLAAHLTRMRAGGFNKIVVFTITSFSIQGVTAKETFRLNANALTRAFTAPTADAIADVGAVTNIMGAGDSAASNSVLYRDGLHPTQVGEIYMEQTFAAALNPLLQ